DRISDDICEHIISQGIDASKIRIEVKNGEVTLEGKVKSRATKYHLEDIAESTLGVKDVHNRIKVESGADSDEQDESMPRSSSGRAGSSSTAQGSSQAGSSTG